MTYKMTEIMTKITDKALELFKMGETMESIVAHFESKGVELKKGSQAWIAINTAKCVYELGLE